MIQLKESDIQRLILDWLAAERIWHIRLNTGAMAGSHKGKKWFVRFGRPGMADILAYPFKCKFCEGSLGVLNEGKRCGYIGHRSQPTWIEVKAANGKQSEAQADFQKEITEQGMTYILARSLEDVIAVLK